MGGCGLGSCDSVKGKFGSVSWRR